MITGLLARIVAALLPAPFEFIELATPNEDAVRLFSTSFGAKPPEIPFHFIARHRRTGDVCGYIHYTEQMPGVYLCGGLCIDKMVYRRLSAAEKGVVARHGSLSRWLLNKSIAKLPRKSAIFAYTGNIMSRRDGLATGFLETRNPRLIVQWHGAPDSARAGLIESISRLGPF